MKIYLIIVAMLVTTILLMPQLTTPVSPKQKLNNQIQQFLESKDSPIAPEIETLMAQKHWKLLIAISAIESQYCKRQLGNNCWGVSYNNKLRKYESIKVAIVEANDLIEWWQKRGRWLTPEAMNCSYVVPCNQNWVIVVNQVLKQLETY